MLYGKGTTWCITEENGKAWDQYSFGEHSNPLTFYFAIPKDPNSTDSYLADKYAIGINEHGDIEEWRDSTDVSIKGSADYTWTMITNNSK